MGGHSTSDDPNRYRGDEQLAPWAARDPIERLRQYLYLHDAWNEARESEFCDEVDRRFKAAVAIAEQTPPPALETMFEDVYAEPPWHLVEQRAALLAGPRAKGHG